MLTEKDLIELRDGRHADYVAQDLRDKGVKHVYTNPFYNPKNCNSSARVITATSAPEMYRGFQLFRTGRWVDAVINGVIETQCVTIAGAKVELDKRIHHRWLHQQVFFDTLTEKERNG